MWKKIDFNVPLNTPIYTKIDDAEGVRNEQKLIYDGKLWWNTDMKSYVYYQPTHYYSCYC